MRLKLGGRGVDLDTREVEGGPALSPAEAALLRALAARPGEVVAQDALMATLGSASANAFARVVARLRQKIEADPSEPRFVRTVRGGGVLLAMDAPADDRRTNLTASQRPLVAREAELAALTRARERARLVTLLGPGGVGKTTLAREWGRSQSGAGEIWFCDLVPARDGDDVARIVAASAGEASAGDLGRALARRGDVTLIVDNCEHVQDDAAALIERWLAAAPRLFVVATSRTPLGLAEEARLPLSPLSPEQGKALFALRAQDVRPDDPHVAELVDAADCLPLAIELLAAQTRVVSPERMLERLRRDDHLLRLRATDVAERQETLARTVGWSWDLLRPPERRALAALGVLVGTFSLQVAEAVVGPGPTPAIDRLHALVDHSLVRASSGRFQLLEAIRKFALERLDEAGERAAVEGRLVAWALARAAEIDTRRVVRSERDLDALLTACDAAKGPDRARLGAVVVARLGPDIPAARRLRIATEVVEHAPDDTSRVLGLVARSIVVRYIGDEVAALADIDAAVALLERGDADPMRLADTLSARAVALRQLGRYDDAEADLRRAHELHVATGNHRGAAMMAYQLGTLYSYWGRVREARERLSGALEVWRAEPDDHERRIVTLTGLANLDVATHPERSLAYLDEAEALARRIDNPARTAFCLAYRALVHAYQGRLDASVAMFEAALSRLDALGYGVPAAEIRGVLAWTISRRGDRDEAVRRMEALVRAAPGPHVEGLAQAWSAIVLVAAGRLDEADAAADAAGSRLHVPPTSGLGHVLRAGAALRAAARGDVARARELFASLDAEEREERGGPMPPGVRELLAHL